MMNYSKFVFGPVGGFPALIIIILIVWDFVWRGMALWRAARHGQRNWFLGLFILSTVGILPIIYLAFFQKKSKTS